MGRPGGRVDSQAGCVAAPGAVARDLGRTLGRTFRRRARPDDEAGRQANTLSTNGVKWAWIKWVGVGSMVTGLACGMAMATDVAPKPAAASAAAADDQAAAADAPSSAAPAAAGAPALAAPS